MTERVWEDWRVGVADLKTLVWPCVAIVSLAEG